MMVQERAFENFAPALLQAYRHDKNAFWDAVMAPFLTNNNSSLARLRHFELDVGLLTVFNGLEAETAKILKEFGAPLGFDVTAWKSNRPQYFKDAYPIFAFLAVWMDEEGLDDLVKNFATILRAGVFAVAGYGILDSKEIAALLRANPTHVRQTFDISKDMLAQSRAILGRLNDSILVRLVDITEARVETYFHQELKMT